MLETAEELSVISVHKAIKNWPSSCSAFGECLYNDVEVQPFSYVSFFSLQQCLSYIVFYGKMIHFKLGCMNELKSGEIKWKIAEYINAKEKKIIPVFQPLILPIA